ncbi:polysaccharide lyase family 8 protein [Collybia nuda]|uniref:Polysaccharide lyase family 8 protein n=1 Tax=Collybia nuda TaxID=64659 RepID=A0A9P6CJR1_9AGAR|nr:polysaccharide lyase family 8 protein [Collybia nuda]
MKRFILTLVLYAHCLFLQSSSLTVNAAPRDGSILGRTSRQPLRYDSPTHHLDKRASIDIVRERRFSSIVADANKPSNHIETWLSSLGSDGKWPDSEVDYTTGCDARRANWPAQEHWQRIVVMAAAWHGGLEGGDQYVKNETFRAQVSLAMDYWFNRDFTNVACLGGGGTSACPCTNPDNQLWNTNWFSNVILIPDLVGQTCLLFGDTLTTSQRNVCIRMTERSFEYEADSMTGANALDVCRIGMDEALLTSNTTLLANAYQRSHVELKIMNGVKADGIRADGAFGQHDGMLYNGNYGKDYANDILGIEVEAAGTEFAASTDSQNAFATLFEGDRWMIYRNVLTGVLHWDFSVLGRFISFPVIDNQATGSINMNLTSIGELGQLWQSQSLIDFESSLLKSTTNANAGSLQGNRMFYTNDYIVQRGSNYVSSVKMWSTRTRHTECTNTQNPLGFHLADGVHYTYLQGNEYEDISVAWDWNMIPGTTTDYGNTPLACGNNGLLGIEAFVGGASNGQIGVASMRYTNPKTKALKWQKAWFFLDNDVQHVMVAGLSSTSSAPVYSILDQRRHNGPILVDGVEHQTSNNTGVHTLFHGGVGYKFSDSGSPVSVRVGQKTGNWSTIGTSTQPPATVDLFAAWIPHQSLTSPISYTVFPGTTSTSFPTKVSQLQLRTIKNDAHISAVVDDAHNAVMAVFWDAAGGSITFQGPPSSGQVTIATNGNAAVVYKPQTGDITVSDPSQSLSSLRLNLTRQGSTKALTFTLPGGGLAGNSVTKNSS